VYLLAKHSENPTSPGTLSNISAHSGIKPDDKYKSAIILISSLSILLITVTSFSLFNILPVLHYDSTTDIVRDILMTILASVLSTGLVKGISSLAIQDSYGKNPINNTVTTKRAKPILSSQDSRKLIHTLSAPLFVLLWPFYSDQSFGARSFASTIVVVQGLRLALAGLGLGGDGAFVVLRMVKSQ